MKELWKIALDLKVYQLKKKYTSLSDTKELILLSQYAEIEPEHSKIIENSIDPTSVGLISTLLTDPALQSINITNIIYESAKTFIPHILVNSNTTPL